MEEPMDELIGALYDATVRNKVNWEPEIPLHYCYCGARLESWKTMMGESSYVIFMMDSRIEKVGCFRKKKRERAMFLCIVDMAGSRVSTSAQEFIDEEMPHPFFSKMSGLYKEILHQQRHLAIEAADKRAEELEGFVAPPPAFTSDNYKEGLQTATKLVREMIKPQQQHALSKEATE